MSDDVIKRAEAMLRSEIDPQPDRYIGARGLIRELIAEVQDERARFGRHVRYFELTVADEVAQISPDERVELEVLLSEFR